VATSAVRIGASATSRTQKGSALRGSATSTSAVNARNWPNGFGPVNGPEMREMLSP